MINKKTFYHLSEYLIYNIAYILMYCLYERCLCPGSLRSIKTITGGTSASTIGCENAHRQTSETVVYLLPFYRSSITLNYFQVFPTSSTSRWKLHHRHRLVLLQWQKSNPVQLLLFDSSCNQNVLFYWFSLSGRWPFLGIDFKGSPHAYQG